jgi:hypothetical protein
MIEKGTFNFPDCDFGRAFVGYPCQHSGRPLAGLRPEVCETAIRLTEALNEFPSHGNKTNHPELSSLSRG